MCFGVSGARVVLGVRRPVAPGMRRVALASVLINHLHGGSGIWNLVLTPFVESPMRGGDASGGIFLSKWNQEMQIPVQNRCM